MELRQKTIRSAAWLVARFAGRQGANTVAFFILATMLSPIEFGVGSIAVAAAMVLRIPVIRGIRDCVIQSKDAKPIVDDTAWWTNIALGFCLSSGLAVLSFPLAHIFQQPELGPLLLVSSTLPIVSSASAIQEARLERAFLHRYLTASQILASILAAIAAILVAVYGGGAWALLTFNLFEVVGIAVSTTALARWIPGNGFSLSESRRQISFAWPLAISALLNGGFPRLVQLVIGGTLGPAATAQFRVGLQVYQLLYQVICAPLVQALLPAFSNISSDPGTRFLQTVSVFSAISLPVFFGAAAISEYLLPSVLGPEWSQAGTLAAIICLASIPLLFSQSLEPILISSGHTRTASAIALSGVIAGLLAVFAATHWGLLIAATSIAVRGMISFPLSVQAAKKYYKIRAVDWFKATWGFFASGLIMYFGVSYMISVFKSYIPQIVMIGAFVFGLFFYCALVRFGVKWLSREIYEEVVQLIPKRLRILF